MITVVAPVLPAHSQVREDSLAVLKALAEASVVFVALMFVTGWSYLAAYYQTFGLNFLELSISPPVVATVAVQLLVKARLVPALLVFLIAAAANWLKLGRLLIGGLIAVLLLAAAGAGAIRGRLVANENTRVDSASLPSVAFSSKLNDRNQPSCVAFQTYGTLDCKLLLHSNGTFYFFQPVPQATEGASMNLNLYMLPDSKVNSVHVLRGLDPKGRLIW